MRQDGYQPEAKNGMACYFNEVTQPSQQEMLGQIVLEILRAGNSLTRKAICAKLLTRLERASGTEQEKHYHDLLGLLLGRIE
ncbi:regulatory protein YcgZ [Pantoea sp. 1.19]|uniref:regulatory protein YcgZ n=1 Tax=Pantoea sp. 1.19 TaxID=1925589 RepID=UPI00094912AF|nr:regulatory protein YcgZ [Pantoea sp. 1.19]